MSVYTGYSTMGFKSGSISKGQFPSKHIGVIVDDLGTTYNVSTVSPMSTSIQLENNGNNTFKMTDIPLVERNLMNHIFTKKGSRIMMPTFGTTIPDKLFEPLTTSVLSDIKAELQAVVNYDPRVSLRNLSVVPDYDRNSVTCTIDVNYIELNMTNRISLNLEFTL